MHACPEGRHKSRAKFIEQKHLRKISMKASRDGGPPDGEDGLFPVLCGQCCEGKNLIQICTFVLSYYGNGE